MVIIVKLFYSKTYKSYPNNAILSPFQPLQRLKGGLSSNIAICMPLSIKYPYPELLEILLTEPGNKTLDIDNKSYTL